VFHAFSGCQKRPRRSAGCAGCLMATKIALIRGTASVRTMINALQASLRPAGEARVHLADRATPDPVDGSPSYRIVGMLAAGMHFPARRMRVGTLNA
jgi:hypothetical protein